MTLEEAEENLNRNWEEMLEQQKGKTDWAREEMRASVKGIYASELRDACISLKEQLKAKDEEIEKLKSIIEEAIRKPMGVEPHSWSDYKIKKATT